ncbi:MAG: site-specific integrase [Actinomycetota bacterium]|nr:site-specific integrase [Actinomycetota bacterium]
MATIREKRRGVWEVRVFTGRDENGQPTQVSRTVQGTKRDAMRVAAQFDSAPVANGAGRTVAEVLEAWVELNDPSWAESTRRDQRSRVRKVSTDRIGALGLARISVADVERWHLRLRKAGVGEAAIRGRHMVLRAALEQAVRWGWVHSNVARDARLRSAKRSPRAAMTAEDVRAVLAIAAQVDPAAELALRIAAVTGARRSELAALRWSDLDGDRLTIDSSIAVRRDAEHAGNPELIDAPTKTANGRAVTVDETTVQMIVKQREVREVVGPYMFSIDEGPPNPDRIGWWWQRARDLSGIQAEWRLHDLRHWAATTAITSGHDVRTVAGRLGHANAAMTLRVYAHVVQSADEALAAGLGGALDV